MSATGIESFLVIPTFAGMTGIGWERLFPFPVQKHPVRHRCPPPHQSRLDYPHRHRL